LGARSSSSSFLDMGKRTTPRHSQHPRFVPPMGSSWTNNSCYFLDIDRSSVASVIAVHCCDMGSWLLPRILLSIL